MPIYVKNNGTWSVSNIRAKKSEVWQNVGTGYIKVNGSWQQFYSQIMTTTSGPVGDWSIPIVYGIAEIAEDPYSAVIVVRFSYPLDDGGSAVTSFDISWREYSVLTDTYSAWSTPVNYQTNLIYKDGVYVGNDPTANQQAEIIFGTPSYATAVQAKVVPINANGSGTEALTQIYYGYCSQCSGGQVGIH